MKLTTKKCDTCKAKFYTTNSTQCPQCKQGGRDINWKAINPGGKANANH